MDKVTQSNAANAEETASAAEELNAQSAELQQAAAQLAVLVGATRGSSHPAPRHAEPAHKTPPSAPAPRAVKTPVVPHAPERRHANPAVSERAPHKSEEPALTFRE